MNQTQSNARLLLLLTLFELGLVILAIGGMTAAYTSLNCIATEKVVYITDDTDFNAEIAILKSENIFAHETLFSLFARLRNSNGTIAPGRYVLKKGMSSRQVINRLKGGLQTPIRVTFNNIRTKERLAGALTRELLIDSTQLLELLNNPEIAKTYGFTPDNFVAMFIPNTYEIYWNVSAEHLLKRMKKEYDRFWTSERQTQAETIKLSPDQVITLASIVYEETKMADEMPRVAGVYLNRLQKGMPLQADPTVKFAMGNFALKRVLARHLTTNSPYNTYRYAGLPPGPICIPATVAIDAVLQAEKHNYLYFCAKEDFSGYHNFANTLTQHTRYARAYTAALNRRGIR